jgi:hypothetical protein
MVFSRFVVLVFVLCFVFLFTACRRIRTGGGLKEAPDVIAQNLTCNNFYVHHALEE